MFESPCVIRSRAISCLDRAGISWQIMFVSQSLSGIWAAVQAGLGITLRTRVGMPDDLHLVRNVLPSPGNLGITLEQRNVMNRSVQEMLEKLMAEALTINKD